MKAWKTRLLSAVMLAAPWVAAAAPAECPRGAGGELCRRVAELESQARQMQAALADNARRDAARGIEIQSLRRGMAALDARLDGTEGQLARAQDEIERAMIELRRLVHRLDAGETLVREELRALHARIDGLGEPADGGGCGQGHEPVCCPAGTTFCGDGCVSLAHDRNHCGACGRSCGELGRCVDGACEAGEPPPAASLLRCHCGDGRGEDACVPSDCDAFDHHEQCSRVCGPRGLSDALPSACLPAAPVCNGGEPPPPPAENRQIICACNDGQRVQGCFETDCNPEDRMLSCLELCEGHGGPRRGVDPVCIEQRDACP